MAERPEDRRFARPIVPDPNSSLAPRRPHRPPPPRVWPLWLLMLLLAGAYIWLAWAGWQERSRFQSELTRLSGEVSNVHARFDAQQGGDDILTSLESRLGRLEEAQAAFGDDLDEQQEKLDARLSAFDGRLDGLQGRLEELDQAGDARDALLASTRMSVDALERVGEEGRAALDERITSLGQASTRDRGRLDDLEAETMAAVESIQATLVQQLTSAERRLEAQLEDVANRQTQLVEEVEAMASSRDDDRQRSNDNADRLNALEDEIAELRRGQLAMSAQLEALQR